MDESDPNYPPEHIVKAIRDAFPTNFDQVMEKLRWDGLMGCWLTEVYGITVGIETDGYIHS